MVQSLKPTKFVIVPEIVTVCMVGETAEIASLYLPLLPSETA
jgi:hypothetical protein